MGTELLQFAGIMVAFAVAALLWIHIIYIPRRTMERWEDEGFPNHNEDQDDPLGSDPPTQASVSPGPNGRPPAGGEESRKVT